MNKNTITGLFLIGLVLTVFAVLNQPSKEEVAAKERKIELAAKEKKTKKVKIEFTLITTRLKKLFSN